jgi:pimeloyl-ACP methyl ester carboxylesterase
MPSYREVRFAAADGLTLYARDYNSAPAGKTPVLCLAGLTRNSKDFEPVIPHMAGHRRVITLDFRGRGQSGRAKDWTTYRPDIETEDAVQLLRHLNVPSAAILGTSRGGIVALVMAAKYKDRISGVLFNDIGPDIETAGLLRIRTTIDQRARVHAWPEAITMLKATNPGYEALSEALWERMARAIFRDESGLPVSDFDPRLSMTFPPAEDIASGKVPALWPLFELLKDVPVSVLRGEHSDLLSPRIVNEMGRRHPALDAVTVMDRGHVPLLDEPESLAAVSRWLERIDATA